MSWSIPSHLVGQPDFFSVDINLRVFHRSVFLNTALLFWSFKIKADPESPIDQWAFTESISTHPLPFKVIFEPRVDLRELLV